MDTCETITILTDNGPVRMNKADYNPAVHVLDGNDPASAALRAAPAVYSVVKIGKKFFVVDANNNKVTNDPTVNADGYDTDGAAWEAALPKPQTPPAS